MARARKVVAERRDGRAEHCAHADAGADPVREEHLVVLFADARHHQAKGVEAAAGDGEVLQIPGVEEGAGDTPQHGAEARVDRADPRDGHRRLVGEQLVLVVLLEDAEGLCHAVCRQRWTGKRAHSMSC